MNRELRYLESLQGSGIRPGLERMRRFLAAAGRPERTFPSILVAGTNGKGSTAATLESILRAAGYVTGLYTSPHLVTIRERWRIGGEPVSAPRLREAIRRLRAIDDAAGVRPTYFEALTILAFLLFERSVEVAVLEVGMGGRLDATNVVRPLASVIAPIGIDHAEWLGGTIGAIAREKAGIIHRGSIAVTSNRDPAALRALEARARRVGVELHRLHDEVDLSGIRSGTEGTSFRYAGSGRAITLRSPLAGEHQAENVALAARTAELLASRLERIGPRAIREGVAATRWRGRLERFEIGGAAVWVDGAHNPHALARIAPFVDRFIPRPRTLVFGVLRDKAAAEMASIIFPLFDRIITTEPPSERALPAAEAARLLLSDAGVPIRAVANPGRAIRAALAGGGSILVCGSLYLAGDAVALLDRLRSEEGPRERGERAAGRPRSRPTPRRRSSAARR